MTVALPPQPAVLKSYAWFANTVAQELDVPVLLSEGEDEPHKTRKTLLKSAFVHSKHRVQYEMRTYFWDDIQCCHEFHDVDKLSHVSDCGNVKGNQK